MEDEHVRIDDLTGHLGSVCRLPNPSAFYGVIDLYSGSTNYSYCLHLSYYTN